MNRAAKCIQMLAVLRARSVVTTDELARILETNPRNIREYRKELEEAGYTINILRGQYGGYQLDDTSLLALPALDAKQINALGELRDYIEADKTLPFSAACVPVLDEILSQTKTPVSAEPVLFVLQNGQMVPDTSQSMVAVIKKAIQERNTLEITYQSKSRPKPNTRKVDPYDLISMEGHWYLCAFDHSHDEFRNYRISPQRMLAIRQTFDYFKRDPEYRLLDHIGQTSLIKAENAFYKVEVRAEQARFFEEISWGMEQKRLTPIHEGWVLYGFYSDNPNHVMRQLYRFGADIRLIQPKSCVRDYVKGLKDILANY